jgi:hypothetical protein
MSCRWSCDWTHLHEWVHMSWSNVHVLQSGGGIVWWPLLERPNVEDTTRLMEVGASKGFSGCLGAWIACTANGTTVCLVGKGSTKSMQKVARSFLKQWHLKIHGVVTCSLAWQDLIMISMCYDDLQFSQGLWKVKHRVCNYEINDTQYTKWYYFADCIYPSWSTFM